MTRRLTTLAAVLLAGALTASSAAASTIRERERHQQRRIGAGVASGQLTPRETIRLERREAAIRRLERRMRAEHGGRLTPHDRAVIDRRLDRVSRDIFRHRHDRR